MPQTSYKLKAVAGLRRSIFLPGLLIFNTDPKSNYLKINLSNSFGTLADLCVQPVTDLWQCTSWSATFLGSQNPTRRLFWFNDSKADFLLIWRGSKEADSNSVYHLLLLSTLPAHLYAAHCYLGGMFRALHDACSKIALPLSIRKSETLNYTLLSVHNFIFKTLKLVLSCPGVLRFGPTYPRLSNFGFQQTSR